MKHTLRHLLMLLAVTLFIAPATHAQGLIIVKKKGKYGFKNRSGEYVVPCKYEDAYGFTGGFAGVKQNGKWGFIDQSDQYVVPCKYEDVGDVHEGLFNVKQNGKWGIINRSGQYVVPCKYDRISWIGFYEGLTKVFLNGKEGFINTSGEEVIPCKYDDTDFHFFRNLIGVKLDKKWGFINTSGEEVISCKYEYDYVDYFYEGFARVKQNEKWGFINQSGQCVVPCKYEDVQNLHKDVACVKLKRKWGVVNTLGEEVVPFKYGNICYAGEGVYFTYIKGKLCYITPSGEVIFRSSEYLEAGSFKNGLAYVGHKKKDEYGYIDHQGNWYDTKEEGLAAIAANPLLAQHEGYSGEDKVTIAQNKELAPAPQTPVAQPKSQPTPQPVTQPIAQPKPQPQPAPQPQVEAPVYASVDADIPQGKALNDKTFVVIVANENYRREQGVEFALNDGEVFKRYCERTLGIPTEQIHLIPDATLNDLHAEVDWLCEVANTYEGEAKILFYYVGHGLPDESTRKAYLLPADGYGSNVVKTGYPLQELYDRLSSIPTRQSLVLLDACFSGGQRDGKMMVSARGIAIAPEDDAPKNNLIVFSATQGDRMAYNYREMKHGMFTYYLLKKLQETKGHVTLGELTDYVKREVERRSIVVIRKKQTPTVMVGDGLTHTWQQISLR